MAKNHSVVTNHNTRCCLGRSRYLNNPTCMELKFFVSSCWFDWAGWVGGFRNLWVSWILWTLLSLKNPRQLLKPKWRTNPPPQRCRRCKRNRNWAKSRARECRLFSLPPFWLSRWLSCWPLPYLFGGKSQGPLEASKTSPLNLEPIFDSVFGLSILRIWL